HEDSNDVALEQKAEDAKAKQNRAKDEIPGKRNHQPSLFPSTTAPMIAMRMSTEVISKGSRKSLKSRRAMLWVSPKLLELMETLPSWPPLWTSSQPTVPASTATPGTPIISAMRLPRVRSSSPAFKSMMTKTKSTMMAPA